MENPYYIERGKGFPLILLHGNGEDCSYFQHQIEPFAQHFRVDDLLQIVNNTIRQMKSDGTLRRLHEKYRLVYAY